MFGLEYESISFIEYLNKKWSVFDDNGTGFSPNAPDKLPYNTQLVAHLDATQFNGFSTIYTKQYGLW